VGVHGREGPAEALEKVEAEALLDEDVLHAKRRAVPEPQCIGRVIGKASSAVCTRPGST
jgi:hypothetical protein